MFMHEDFWLPDGEQHWLMPKLGSYQDAGRNAAYSYVKDWRIALDLGGNVGIFARDFASRFDRVHTFEPIPSTAECLQRNVPENVTVEPFAVADQQGELQMTVLVKGCGGSFIRNHPDIPAIDRATPKSMRDVRVQVRTIDSYGFEGVGLMKLDIQGAEYLALRGAEATIRRCRPVILIEEKPRSDDPDDVKACRLASEFLLGLGMTGKEKPGGDRVYVFE